MRHILFHIYRTKNICDICDRERRVKLWFSGGLVPVFEMTRIFSQVYFSVSFIKFSFLVEIHSLTFLSICNTHSLKGCFYLKFIRPGVLPPGKRNLYIGIQGRIKVHLGIFEDSFFFFFLTKTSREVKRFSISRMPLTKAGEICTKDSAYTYNGCAKLACSATSSAVGLLGRHTSDNFQGG